MGILQLNPPILVVTPLGPASAYFTYTDNQDKVVFGVFQTETGENWWWENHLIRLDLSITGGRFKTTEIKLSPEQEAAMVIHKKRYKDA